MVEDLTKWQKLINEHDSLVWKLEHSKVSGLLGNYPQSKVLVIKEIINKLSLFLKIQIATLQIPLS